MPDRTIQGWPDPEDAYADKPAGVRASFLNDLAIEAFEAEELEKGIEYGRIADDIQGTHVRRNLQGQELEKTDIEQAIALYEANIAELTDTPFPYGSLRVIYTRQERYDDAIRVLQKYIEMSQAMGEPPSSYDRYAKWIREIEAKREKQK